MFRRALKAIGGPKPPKGAVGGRWVLVPRSSEYPDAMGPGERRKGPSAAERRRRNLTVLSGFIIVSFLIGLLPPFRFVLYGTLLGCVLLVAYLGAAIYYAARPVAWTRSETEVEAPQTTAPEAAGGGW